MREKIFFLLLPVFFVVVIVGIEILQTLHHPFLRASSAPPSFGVLGPLRAKAFALTVIGDSTAASLGANRAEETVAAQLAGALHDRRVAWRSYGLPGARVGDIFPQVRRVLRDPKPDAVVVLIGANDVLRLTPSATVRRNLFFIVQTLRAHGIPVIVGTCPEMGAPAFPFPLREIISARGRRIGSVEQEAVRAAGGIPVDLAAKVGPLFRADASTLASDEFHPSARGYALWAQALAPALRAALQ